MEEQSPRLVTVKISPGGLGDLEVSISLVDPRVHLRDHSSRVLGTIQLRQSGPINMRPIVEVTASARVLRDIGERIIELADVADRSTP